MELQEWPDFLSRREIACEKAAMKWWFHLYKLLLGTKSEDTQPCNTSQSIAVSHSCSTSGSRTLCAESEFEWLFSNLHVKSQRIRGGDAESSQSHSWRDSLFSTLDQFVRTSTLGEYKQRLKLLGCFSVRLSIQHSSDQAEDSSKRLILSSVLHNLQSYYAQWIPAIESEIDRLRAPIQTKLKNQEKLARWDDQTYFSLREASEKTHRNLHKLIREYDDILDHAAYLTFERSADSLGDNGGLLVKTDDIPQQFSTSPLMSKSVAFTPQTNSYTCRWLDFLAKETTETKYSHQLGNLKLKYAVRCKRAVLGKEAAVQLNDTGMQPEHLNRMILGRLRHLQSTKASQAAKSRAFVDLLKALEKEGLSRNSSTTPVETRSVRKVFEVPSLQCFTNANQYSQKNGPLDDGSLVNMWDAAERSYFRCFAQLQRLRVTTSSGYSAELSAGQVQRSLAHCEHGMLILLQQRHMMRELHIGYEKMKHLEKSLGSLTSSLRDGSNFVANKDLDELYKLIQNQSLLIDAIFTGIKEFSLLGNAVGSSQRSNVKDFIHEVSKSLGELEKCRASLTEFNDVGACFNSGVFRDDKRAVKIFVQNTARLAIVRDSIDRARSVAILYVPLEATRELFDLLNQGASLVLPKSYITDATPHGTDADQSLSTPCANSNRNAEFFAAQIAIEVDSAVEPLLIGAQHCLKAWDCELKQKEGEQANTSVREREIVPHHNTCVRAIAGLQLDYVVERVQSIVRAIRGRGPAITSVERGVDKCISFVLTDFLSMLHCLVSVLEQLFIHVLAFHTNSGRLFFLVLRIFRSLHASGFCRPPEDEDDPEADDGEMGEGTGMGEGHGQTDVTDEIEDEEQLLGLNEDKQKDDDDPRDEEKGEDGMEMQNEFEGEMHDTVKEENNDELQSDDEGNDEEELERDMGDLGDDQNVVDEKEWNNESEDEGPSKDELFEENAAMAGENEDDELRAKDTENEGDIGHDEENESAPTDVKDDDAPEDCEEEKDTGGNDDNNSDVNNEGMEESHELKIEGQNEGEDMDVEGGPLEDEDEVDEHDQSEDDELDADDLNENREDRSDDNGSGNDFDDDENVDENEENNVDRFAEEIADGEAGEENAEQPNDAEISPPNNANSDDDRADHSEIAEQCDGVLGDNLSGKSPSPVDPTSSSQRQQKPQRDEPQVDQEVNNETGPPGTNQGSSEGRHGSECCPMENLTDNSNRDEDIEQSRYPPMNSLDPNPWRSPGDAQKHWHKRLNMEPVEKTASTNLSLDHLDKTNELDSITEAQEKLNYNFSTSDEVSTTQVLAPTNIGESQHEKVVPDEMFDAENDDGVDDLTEGKEENVIEVQSLLPDRERKMLDSEKSENEFVSQMNSIPDRMEEEIEPSNTLGNGDKQENIEQYDEDNVPGILHVSDDVEPVEMDTDLVDIQKNALNLQHTRTHSCNNIPSLAHEAWASYVGQTAELSQRLCEQLRLQLAPTLATKLRGDYRTGKRINMRKVIPYIASQFRKDKIWLRRTKPSKRQYQVVLAIDNSKSMAGNHGHLGAGQLALQALCTISKAMARLEVGELAVVSFGQEVRMLHALSEPFTDAAGARVISNFTFADESTQIEASLKKIVQLLAAAHGHSGRTSSVKFKQLVFFISDGHFDSTRKDSIRRWIREAIARQQLIVLLIVEDPEKQKESILNKQSVTFNGSELCIKASLEDYPFPYYIVLRHNLNSLPEMLGDALRQPVQAT